MQFRKDQKGSERGGEMEFREFLHSEGSSFLNQEVEQWQCF